MVAKFRPAYARYVCRPQLLWVEVVRADKVQLVWEFGGLADPLAVMDTFSSFDLSLLTLLGFFSVPFAFFVLHSKYGHTPEFQKKIDFLLQAAACLLAGAVLVKIALLGREASLDYRLLAFLHLGPLALTILMVGYSKKFFAEKGTPSEALMQGSNDYKPLPVADKVEKVGWEDLVISANLKNELIAVINLLKDPQTAKKYGVQVPKGILLQGPPGTGKTSLAKVVATSAQLSFFALRMDEVVSKWVGESEKNLSRLFETAQQHAPAVIFIDEVESIGRTRSSGSQSYADNLLNHLLQLIDGVVKTEGLYLIAATNRVELVDDALKRPGRLNKVIYIPLPDFDSRKEIFKRCLSKLPLAAEPDLDFLAGSTIGKSGAVITQICNQAGLNAFQRESQGGYLKRSYKVTADDINDALFEFSGSEQEVEDVKAVVR